MAERNVDWYFKASNELLLNKDNEDTRALLEETRAALRDGQHPAVLITSLKVKGTRNNANGVVGRAMDLEMPGIMRAAAEDLAAGRTSGPAMDRARDLAAHILKEKPSGEDLHARMKAAGAPDNLIAHLAADPALKAGARQMAWIYFGLGVLIAVLGVWYYTTTPPAEMPYGATAFAIAAVLLLTLGVRGLTRK
jgi:hypothetical protein